MVTVLECAHDKLVSAGFTVKCPAHAISRLSRTRYPFHSESGVPVYSLHTSEPPASACSRVRLGRPLVLRPAHTPGPAFGRRAPGGAALDYRSGSTAPGR